MRAWGLPVEPHWRACDGIDERRRVLPRVGRRSGRRSSSTPTASSSRSTTWRCASGSARPRSFRAGRPRSSFPAQQATTDAAADRGQRRPDRRRDAVRRARAGAPRRLDDLDGDAAQRRGHRAQGHPRGRPRAHREGRRRHPEGRRRRSCSRRPPDSAAVADADDLPGLRQRAAPRRGGSRLALREHVVSGAAPPQPRALRVALGDEHRGARRVADRSADRAGPGARLRRPLSPRRPRSSRTWSSRRASRARNARVRASWARSAATSSSRSSAARRTICRG